MEGRESFVVNSSARHCNRCHKKIRHAVTAVDTGGVGAAVDASAGGGRDTDAVHDILDHTGPREFDGHPLRGCGSGFLV